MSEHRPLNCEEAVARLDDYLDRELSSEEMRLVSEHLKTCAHCAEAFAFEEHVLADLRDKIRRIDVPTTLVDTIRAVLRSA
jgi:anti-sigma factor (TIGR02949 family)